MLVLAGCGERSRLRSLSAWPTPRHGPPAHVRGRARSSSDRDGSAHVRQEIVHQPAALVRGHEAQAARRGRVAARADRSRRSSAGFSTARHFRRQQPARAAQRGAGPEDLRAARSGREPEDHRARVRGRREEHPEHRPGQDLGASPRSSATGGHAEEEAATRLATVRSLMLGRVIMASAMARARPPCARSSPLRAPQRPIPRDSHHDGRGLSGVRILVQADIRAPEQLDL